MDLHSTLTITIEHFPAIFQESEGFSLEVQKEALRRYASPHDGEIVRFFRITETASKTDEQKTFKDLVHFGKEHCMEIDGL